MKLSRRDLFKGLGGGILAALLPKLAGAEAPGPNGAIRMSESITGGGYYVSQELIDDAVFAKRIRRDLEMALHEEMEREFLNGMNGGGIGNPIGILG